MFAGVVVAISFNLVLAVLGIGIGLTTIDPTQAESPQASTLGIAATVWWIVTALLSLASGGWVAGRLAGMPTRLDGALHGLVTWGIATILIFWLLTSAVGSLIGGAFSVVGNALSNAAQGAAQATDQVDPNSLQGIQDEARELLAPNGGSLPQASLNVLNRIVRGEVTQEEMQSAASSLAEQAGIPEEKARETLNNWQAQYNQAVEQARQAAQTAAKTGVESSTLVVPGTGAGRCRGFTWWNGRSACGLGSLLNDRMGLAIDAGGEVYSSPAFLLTPCF